MNAQFKILAKAIMLVALFVTSLSSQTCDENAAAEIDAIKQNAETMLVYSATARVKLVSGETLTAFYYKGSLIKISVDNSENDGPYSSAELFFKDGFIKHIAEEYSKNGKFFKDYYYFSDDKLVCYTNEKSGDYKNVNEYVQAQEKRLRKVNIYLEAVQ